MAQTCRFVASESSCVFPGSGPDFSFDIRECCNIEVCNTTCPGLEAEPNSFLEAEPNPFLEAEPNPFLDRPSPDAAAASRGLGGASALFNIVAREAKFPDTALAPEIVTGKIIQGAMLLIGVIFGILVIYGGYLWMIARGNEETVKKAINILQTAVIGFVIVVAAYAIANFVVDKVITAAFQ